jgi:hypothetical protein
MIILISMFDYVVDVFYPARIHLLIVIILAATSMVRMVLNLLHCSYHHCSCNLLDVGDE